MPQANDIEDLMEKMRSALELAFRRGVAEGKREADEFRNQMLAALGAPKVSSSESSRKGAKVKKVPGKGRAPKGTVPMLVDQTFAEGMTTKELQEAVAEKNASVSPKSVYNELAKVGSLYEQRDGKWFKKAKPAETGSAPPVQAPTLVTPLSALAMSAPAPATAASHPTATLTAVASTPSAAVQPVAPAATPTPAVAPSATPANLGVGLGVSNVTA